ncbi:MAG: hypothetical protein ACI4P1_02400 [Erysipelotrichaceae bacterium]|nr:hypothetical protein [Bacillota bacterium]
MYRKYFLPIAVLLGLSLGVRWLDPLLNGTLGEAIIIILRAVLLFCFGLSLNIAKRKRYETWVRKVLISFVFIFFLVWDLGYIMIPELKTVFNYLGLYGYIVYLIYIYCGWSFFD